LEHPGEIGREVLQALPALITVNGASKQRLLTMKYYVMKYCTSTTEFNCGIDLHARQMYVYLIDRQGNKRIHCNVKNITPIEVSEVTKRAHNKVTSRAIGRGI
jgi:hypothetical protein